VFAPAAGVVPNGPAGARKTHGDCTHGPDSRRRLCRRPTAPPAAGDLEAVEQLAAAYRVMRTELGKVIVGQEEVVEQVLTAMFCTGHVLLVGVPGLAKTLLVSTISKVLHLGSSGCSSRPT
jgi:hypothetical protein